MKVLVAVSESGREAPAGELVRVPTAAEAKAAPHLGPHGTTMLPSRWVGTSGPEVWKLAKVIEPPECFTVKAVIDTPELRQALSIAADYPLGTIVKLLTDGVAYFAVVCGPN